MAGGLVLVCGAETSDTSAIEQASGLPVCSTPARPGKVELRPVFAALDAERVAGEARLVVAGTDADLAAVVLRLLRADALATTAVGFVPDGDSPVAKLWRLPTRASEALRLAVRGDVDPLPLIRDDSGGVLLGQGIFSLVRGVAYCDDTTVLRGLARRIEVAPDTQVAAPGLVAKITKGALVKRMQSTEGRAFQLGCMPASPSSDGVPYPRQIQRWTWYRHTTNLRAIRGLG